MSHETSHIFICFSSKDEAVAREVAQFLEAEGLKCWFSSRDVSGGQNYQETIVNAIESASGMVFLFSTNSSASGEVRKELSLAGSVRCAGLSASTVPDHAQRRPALRTLDPPMD